MSDWITDSQDEQTIEELFRDVDQLHIPIFQRSYVWKQKQFDELRQDIRLVRDGIEDSQFLGAIVTYERPRQHEIVGRLKVSAIVDGQQRLLTLYIYVMAIVEHLAKFDVEEAMDVVSEFLLLPSRRGLDVNTRVVPAYADRSQFRLLWDRLNSLGVLQKHMQANPPKPPAPSGSDNGDLEKQYKRMYSAIRKALPREEGEKKSDLKLLLNYVTRCLTFVHLKLNDASSATKIFERLNFRGVRVGIVDLVRNEVFSKVSDDPGEAHRLFTDVWQPFEASFDGQSEAFFFPYCLIHSSNTKKSEIFREVREIWKDLSPEEIVNHMRPYQGPYMAIDSSCEVEESAAVSDRLQRLKRLRRPTVSYPFLMAIVKEFVDGAISEEQCVSVLDGVEVFLVRRAILGWEPTGLHALFKSLRGEIEELSPAGLAAVVASKPTIQWASDEEVRIAIKERPLAKAKICGFLLQEYDSSLPGDEVRDTLSIEHVLPQSYTQGGHWASIFSATQHKQLKDTLANVIPLSQQLNSSIQANAYDKKRPRYQTESKFVTPRYVAEKYDEWTLGTLESRANELAAWALDTWPNP